MKDSSLPSKLDFALTECSLTLFSEESAYTGVGNRRLARKAALDNMLSL